MNEWNPMQQFFDVLEQNSYHISGKIDDDGARLGIFLTFWCQVESCNAGVIAIPTCQG